MVNNLKEVWEMLDWKELYHQGMRLYRNNEKYVKLAVIALVVITALVFFGVKGEKEEIPVIQSGELLEQNSEPEAGDFAPVEPEKLFVDISGCVKNPGVYEIKEGTRLYQVIEMADGFTKDADTDTVNQAELLYDGQKIIIPKIMTSADSSPSNSGGLSAGITAEGKVNINIANSTELQEIPGVGPATAEKILAYRESHGNFSKLDELKNIDGIGDKTFEKIKDMITL